MTTFTIDNENNIMALGPQEEIPAAEGANTIEIFASEKELASLAAKWPSNRLVEVWNGFAGAVPFDDLKPVKKFTDRKSAVARIWSAVQRLNADVAPQVAQDAPKEAAVTTEAAPKKKAPKAAKKAESKTTRHIDLLVQERDKKAKAKKEVKPKAAREGSKTTTVLDLIRRPKGATLNEIMAATGWQAHSVRGFISGTVGKKMGLTVESSKREDGERVYKLAK